MALKLGELLINQKLFTRKQLEEALEAQAVFGGRLGTILIEMGAIGEFDLAQALSRQLGVPFVHSDQLVDIPASALNALTPELAQTYQVLPVRLENRTLTVVMANPCDLKAIEELGFRTGYVIRPIVAPELRLTYALEHYYRLPRKPREYVTHPVVRKELARLRRGGPDAAAPIASPPREPEITDLGAALAGTGGEAPPPRPAMPTAVHGEKPVDGERPQGLRATPAGLPLSLEGAARRLTAVRHHDDVAAALLNYLGPRYARVALFKVSSGQAIGWHSAYNGRPISGFQNLRFSLKEASALQAAFTTQQYVSGPPGKSVADLALLMLFGDPVPTNSLILPLSMSGRIVSLIYLDDPRLNPAEALSDLRQLAEMALLSFELLMIRRKILRLKDRSSYSAGPLLPESD